MDEARDKEQALDARVTELQAMLDSISKEKSICEQELEEKRNELIQTHSMLELSHERNESLKQDIRDKEDEIESKSKILDQSLSDRESLSRELEAVQANALSMEQELEILRNEVNAEGQDKSLQEENLELKKLRAVSNESIETSREQVSEMSAQLRYYEEELSVLKMELETTKKELDVASSTSSSSTESSEAIARLEATVVELEKKHADSQAELQDSIRRERMEIIQAAEKKMEHLIAENSELKTKFSQSESEAYVARQRNEELKDELEKRLKVLEALESEKAELEKLIETKKSELAEKCANEVDAAALREATEYASKLEQENTLLTTARSELEDQLRKEQVKLAENAKRIKKLEAHKITQNHIDTMKSLKVSHSESFFSSSLLLFSPLWSFPVRKHSLEKGDGVLTSLCWFRCTERRACKTPFR